MGPPSIPIAIVIIVAAGAIAALLMVVVRRIAGGPPLAEPTRGTPMTTVVGTTFAILLAFTIVNASQTYSGAKSAADSEATTTLEMFRTMGFFSAEERDTVRSDIVCYARAVAYSEWPAMAEGRSSPLVVPWIDRWNEAFRNLELRSDRERSAFSELLTQDRARTDAGVERFRAATSSVPPLLWFVLILGACLTVALQLSMAGPLERPRVQGAMIAAVAAILTTGVLLVDYLDHPYSDHPGRVKPTAMEFTLAATESIQPGLKPPCAADGRPLEGPSASA